MTSFEETIVKRNSYLEHALSNMDGQIKIIGNPEKPAFIYNDSLVLSMYVRNFNLIFMGQAYGGIEIKRFKLRKGFVLAREDIIDLIKASSHKPIFKIQLNDTDLFFWGWKFKNYKAKEDRYPVFSRINGKLFYTKEKVKEELNELETLRYFCLQV